MREGAIAQEINGRKLFLGPSIMDLAFSSWNPLKMTEYAQPAINAIRDRVRETVFLGVLLRKRVLLLFASSDDALKVRQLGVEFSKLNLGNMHSSAGKDRYTCTIALDQKDIDILQKVEDQGVTIVSQCVPADREQNWHKLIRVGGR